jgi:hypothetical protein
MREWTSNTRALLIDKTITGFLILKVLIDDCDRHLGLRFGPETSER